MTTKRRGRVKGRALAKQTPDLVEHTSWNDFFLRAIYGEGGHDIYEMVIECFRLAKKQQELEELYKSFGSDRVGNAVLRCLKNLRGTTLPMRCSFVPADMVRGARKDKFRDTEVYRYYSGLVELEKAEDDLDKKLGCYVRGCIVTKDVRDLERIRRATELDGRAPVDFKRVEYLRAVGKDKDGKIIRKHQVTRNWLSNLTGLHGRELERYGAEFGVELLKGKPGRHKKYRPKKH